MEFTKEEVEIIKKLVDDYGFEYSLQTKLSEVRKIAEKLNIEDWLSRYEGFED